MDGTRRWSPELAVPNQGQQSHVRDAGRDQGGRGGRVAHFGTWSVGEADKALLLRVDGSFYPIRKAAVDKLVVSNVTADELQMLNASSVGGTTEATFRRVK